MAERTPPLHDEHRAADADFTDFGGWSMPVEFDGIRTEHEAVRESVGRFDVSHMGQVVVSGPGATELMDRLTTNDVEALSVGDAQYAAITDERGVMLDDTVVYRLPDRQAQPAYRFVPNAGHDEQMAERWRSHRDRWGLAAEVDDRTGEDAMLAIQGPEAMAAMAEIGEDVSDLGRFEARWADVAGVECWVARTGYTGEDGVELICPAGVVDTVWNELDCQRCGLGARDTLRLEAGLLLSGQDFDAEDNPRTPYEADLGFVVEFDSDFVGLDALAEQAEEGVAERIVGFELEERGVPRHGYSIESADGETIGEVTSGTMSPTLDEAIGLGYVPIDYTEPGTDLRIVVRDDPKVATVRELPFLE
ncbi:glycine cleavage system aminomethyltransferase T [Salinarchaeum sp. Harcht-Bsk1]|uniref:glycine cleavage system aminomethyltransferase GcvT n=1 Tax=Salinarchaeum sp. Harcht-Bsk1 TaxID=1333523 RepID=UPI0003422BC0|nr:glycine cleavage system aminomethyltransferase GcvT [Salinarchaeum sp. Harcht-Bsk1]AGN01096.1 glycine cleavage system aminomethyltransferase T [Salinarchaeum sp. Harcht-Bsk1]